jgi:hypothetical protein
MAVVHLPMPFAQLPAQFLSLLRRELLLRRGLLTRRLAAQFVAKHFAFMRRHALATTVSEPRLSRQGCQDQRRDKDRTTSKLHGRILCTARASALRSNGKRCNKP